MKLHNDSKDSEKSKYLIKLKIIHQKGRETERFFFRSLSWHKGISIIDIIYIVIQQSVTLPTLKKIQQTLHREIYLQLKFLKS